MMTTLKNGATVLAEALGAPGERVVLAVRETSHATEYVTWLVDAEGEAFWGHYFTDLDQAMEDFDQRWHRKVRR